MQNKHNKVAKWFNNHPRFNQVSNKFEKITWKQFYALTKHQMVKKTFRFGVNIFNTLHYDTIDVTLVV